MQAWLGADPWEFLLVDGVIFGAFALLMGQALAGTWRPMWQVLPYAVLLAATARFFNYALFGGTLLSASGFVSALAVTLALGWLSYRVTRARKMVSQSPWLYERAGLSGWRERSR